MRYISTKTYGHEVGLSCAFRQWRADSHCSKLHGYALSVRVEFEAEELDDRNWVVDFGGLKGFKNVLCALFDHTTIVAQDDPYLPAFKALHEQGVLELVVLPHTGCEKFAEVVFYKALDWLHGVGLSDRCKVRLVEVKEHGANSAIYRR